MKLTEGISRMLCQIVVFCVFGISHLLSADVSITGIISKDVVLPCKFQPAPLSEIVLHWTRDLQTKTIVVHSFYRETDQLSQQPIRYNGRTKIFIDKITNGNASLQLSGVNKTDEGQYQCYVSTSQGKFELVTSLQVAAEWKNVKLDSPNMLTPGDSAVNITCSAFGAYPKPSLLWQDENGKNLINQASSKDSVDAEGLHNVKSILKIDQLSNKTYKCNIKIERLQKSWTATWKMQAQFNETEDKDITMTCSEFTNNDQVLKITWKFRETESSQLVTKCESIHQNGNIRTSCQTKQSEMLINRNQSSLILQHINLKDAGEYICEVTTSNMMQMFTYTLTVSASRTQEETPKRKHILAYVVAALSSALFIVVLLCCQHHDHKT